MTKRLKVAVLGPIPKDRITTYQNEVFEKFGCAIYTAAAIARMGGDHVEVHMVSHVRAGDLARIHQTMAGFKNVDLSHVFTHADQGAVIELTYVDQNRRQERQTGFMNPILPENLDGLMDCDAFVFVPITDFEVPLETLRHIRNNSAGIIVFDAHGPTNGASIAGQRHHRFWVDRDRWLPYIDVLKMNMEEARCSWFDGELSQSHPEQATELTMDELPKFARHCIDRGVKAVYVTLDQHGSAVYFNDERGRFREHVVKRVPVEHVVDTTGCGDSFAGGLAFGYLWTNDYVQACWYANCAGAQRCTSSELDVYGSLEETQRRIAETYGD